MNQYVSLLRGINVSGQKKILMADLKALYQSLGFTNVVTYIQSGNVIFTCLDKDLPRQQKMIEQAIEEKYGFDISVTICSSDKFSAVLENIPFKNIDIDEEGTKVLVTFLSDIPAKDRVESLYKYVITPEQLIINGDIVYLYCPNGYGKSKLSNVFLEKKLNLLATTRNLKSVANLNSLMQVEQ